MRAGRIFAIWFVILFLAVANGAFREFALVPRVGVSMARVISTLLLCAFVLAVTYVAIPWIGPTTPRAALSVGAVWLVMTLLFEFGFGRYRGNSWAKLFEDYDLLNGHVWVLVPVATLIAPLLAARARGMLVRP